MPIQLDLQLIVPDENREKLFLLFQHAIEQVKGYHAINPDASPPYANDHTEPDGGRIVMTYDIV